MCFLALVAKLSCCALVWIVQAWQTVAAEFYDPHGQFSQAQWASQLLTVLKAHDGALRTRADTYKALTELVAALGDKYSTFLDPSVSAPARTSTFCCASCPLDPCLHVCRLLC